MTDATPLARPAKKLKNILKITLATITLFIFSAGCSAVSTRYVGYNVDNTPLDKAAPLGEKHSYKQGFNTFEYTLNRNEDTGAYHIKGRLFIEPHGADGGQIGYRIQKITDGKVYLLSVKDGKVVESVWMVLKGGDTSNLNYETDFSLEHELTELTFATSLTYWD